MVTEGVTSDWTGTRPMGESENSDQVPWPRFFVMLISPPAATPVMLMSSIVQPYIVSPKA
jgi:hypothetical protein